MNHVVVETSSSHFVATKLRRLVSLLFLTVMVTGAMYSESNDRTTVGTIITDKWPDMSEEGRGTVDAFFGDVMTRVGARVEIDKFHELLALELRVWNDLSAVGVSDLKASLNQNLAGRIAEAFVGYPGEDVLRRQVGLLNLFVVLCADEMKEWVSDGGIGGVTDRFKASEFYIFDLIDSEWSQIESAMEGGRDREVMKVHSAHRILTATILGRIEVVAQGQLQSNAGVVRSPLNNVVSRWLLDLGEDILRQRMHDFGVKLKQRSLVLDTSTVFDRVILKAFEFAQDPDVDWSDLDDVIRPVGAESYLDLSLHPKSAP